MTYLHGRTTMAVQLFGRVLEMPRALHRDGEIAYVMRTLAAIHLLHGETETAQRLLADAIGPARSRNNSRVVAQVLYRTGQAHPQTGPRFSAARLGGTASPLSTPHF